MIVSVDFVSKADIASLEPGPNTIAVSIVDPGDFPPRLSPGFLKVIRLEFHDRIGDPSDFDAPRDSLDVLEFIDRRRHDNYIKAGFIPFKWVLFSESDALALAREIVSLQESTDVFQIVVHCFAGKSRSAAVASVIAEFAGIPLAKPCDEANPRILAMLSSSIAQLLDGSTRAFRFSR